jgi:phosphate acetyltransferase
MQKEKFSHTPNVFTSSLIEKLRRHPKRIVFTEGEDLRILRAAEHLVTLEAMAPILLGDRDRIRALAEKNDISLLFINILDPSKSKELPRFVEMFDKSNRARGVEMANSAEVVARPQYFGAMMLQYGLVDVLVGGNQVMPASLFRALLQTIKPLPHVPRVFGAMILVAPHLKNFGRDGVLFFSDCGLISDPTIDQLASMAVETGKLARHFMGVDSNVVLLSHSTKGSSNTSEAQKVAAATMLAKNMVEKQLLKIAIDGELQADVALDPVAAEIKLPDAAARQTADVLIFPNLDAAHISLKLLKHTAGAQDYGQIIMGLARSAAQISRAATEESIFGTALAIGYEGIKFHQLYPDGEV